jgi:hypothetical protein
MSAAAAAPKQVLIVYTTLPTTSLHPAGKAQCLLFVNARQHALLFVFDTQLRQAAVQATLLLLPCGPQRSLCRKIGKSRMHCSSAHAVVHYKPVACLICTRQPIALSSTLAQTLQTNACQHPTNQPLTVKPNSLPSWIPYHSNSHTSPAVANRWHATAYAMPPSTVTLAALSSSVKRI